MTIRSNDLAALIAAVFGNAGSSEQEAETVARHLVEANLAGHDSHGAIRVPAYVGWVEAGTLIPNQSISTVFENGAAAVVDGNFGFGQVVGEQAVALGIGKCAAFGLSMVGLRNAGHVGRVGDWAIQAADAGLLSMHFVNTSGGGILVAPWGGTERRLSANPIAAGIPAPGRPPLIVDMSTCVIAEGKIRVARNKGARVPEGAILDGAGRPTTDPERFYADPPGAILPIAGHKGYVLSVLVEALAGALTGGGSSHPGNPAADRVSNGMLSIFIDPATVAGEAFGNDIERLVAWAKTARKAEGVTEILMPGDPENRMRAERLANGIPLDDATLEQLAGAARKVGVPEETIARLTARAAPEAAQ